jgi:hypothetical protein
MVEREVKPSQRHADATSSSNDVKNKSYKATAKPSASSENVSATLFRSSFINALSAVSVPAAPTAGGEFDDPFDWTMSQPRLSISV